MTMNNTTLHDTKGDNLTNEPGVIEVLSALWMLIVFVLGVVENSVILFVFSRNKHFITTNNVPIIALLFNGFCQSAFSPPLPFIAEISGGWHVRLSDSWCVFEGFIVYLFGLTSLYLLLQITLIRYVTITRPIQSSQMTKTHAAIGVVVTYILGAIFAICPLVGFGSYGLEAHGTSCGLAWDDTSSSGKAYLIVILVFCFLLPLAIMVGSYTAIFKVVRKSSVFPSENSASLRLKRQREKEQKLIKLSIIMVLTYLTCWTPYAIVSFYIAFGDPGHLHPLVTRLPAFFAKSEVIWNPIIYTLQTRQFRNRVVQTIPCRFIRDRLEQTDDGVTQMQASHSSNIHSAVPEASSMSENVKPSKKSEDKPVKKQTELFVVEEAMREGSVTRLTSVEDLSAYH